VRQLKAFQRVTLKPGESRAVNLRVAAQDLWFYGLDMKRVVEPGTFHVYVGPNSAEGNEGQFDVVP
jgi:beta-glucosidase